MNWWFQVLGFLGVIGILGALMTLERLEFSSPMQATLEEVLELKHNNFTGDADVDVYFEAENSEIEEDIPYPSIENIGDYSPLSTDSIAYIFFQNEGNGLKRNKSAPARTHLAMEEKSIGIHVITTFFHEGYAKRRFSEILATLVSNLENPYISFVHCLWEKESPAWYLSAFPHLLAKLIAVETKTQPTYKDLFSYSNAALSRGSVAIVTNADIYFDSSLKCVLGPVSTDPVPENRQRSVYAISRRHSPLCNTEADHNGLFDLCLEYVHSHDAFVFAVPVPNEVLSKTDHFQNRYGGENIVIWEFAAAGFHVWNPCMKIRPFHLHCSAERHYKMVFIDGFSGVGPYRHGIVYPGTVRTSAQRRYGFHSEAFVKCMTRIA